jgi:hypothetical protein
VQLKKFSVATSLITGKISVAISLAIGKFSVTTPLATEKNLSYNTACS